MPRRILILLVSSAVALVAQAPSTPIPVPNSNFEAGAIGQPPPSWQTGTPDGFQVSLIDQGCLEGERCAIITAAPNVAGTIGGLSTAVAGAPLRARTIRFRAAVRVAPGSSGQMWLRVDRAGGGYSYFDNMSDRPIRSSEWAYYAIEAPVASDVSNVVFGVFLATPGEVWFDDVTLDVIGELRSEPAEEPRPLSDEGIENIAAFAKLAGYIRYFHPSDQAAEADWDTFLINGVRRIESAGSPQDLAGELQSIFDPLAPTVRVHVEGANVPTPPELVRETANATSVVRWDHSGLGIGVDGPSIYNSTRRTASLPGNQLPTDYDDPASTYNAPLARGVMVRVPTVLYADDAGTLPHRDSAAPTEAWLRTVDDRATRLAGVIITWNVLRHFYPYMDITDVDMEAELRRALRGAAEDTGAADFLVTMDKLLAAMQDGHGGVNYEGWPVFTVPLLWAWVEDQVIVTRVKDAQGQQVQPGDRVVSIDGVAAETALAQIEDQTPGATPQWVRLRSLRRLGYCDQTTERMTVEIEPYGQPGERRSMQFDCRRSDFDWSEARPETVTYLEPGIVYVNLDRLTASDWTAALPRLQNASGIVFDLRGYPEFYPPAWVQHLAVARVRSELFHYPTPRLPDQTNLTYRESFFELAPLQPRLTAKTVFLIDASAISQSETDLDWVEHYHLGELVGEATAGTTGNINPFTLPGNFRIVWTGLRVLKQDGSRFHGVGIRPTIPTSRTRQGIAEGRDELLLQGIEIARGPKPGPTPTITAAGIVNAATFEGGPVAPGEMVTIFGANLGPAELAHSKFDFSGYLENYAGETRVFFDDEQAPVVYASQNQVTVLVPYEVGTSAGVIVEYQGRVSNEVTIDIANAAPGIFAAGSTQAVAVNQDGTLNSETNPATRGEIITLFGTGEGQTTPPCITGKLPAQGKWPVPQGELRVVFGGIPGEVVFLGTKTGVLQVNVRVPAGASAGPAVQVILEVAGVAGQQPRTVALK